MLRLGVCGSFHAAPIRFRHTTAAYVLRQPAADRVALIEAIALDNARALVEAVRWCAANGAGAYRILNDVVPLANHPAIDFHLDEASPALLDALGAAGRLARELDVRLSFHPDPFVVLGSVREDVVRASLGELEHLARLAERVGAEQLTVHGGSAAGGKADAAERLVRGVERASPRVRRYLAFENDDRTWTVEDLAPVLRATGLPLVYDAHHHRCNPDTLSEADATDLAASSWGDREPWFHLSSPAEGWAGPKPLRHAETIDPADVPACWRGRRMTVDVEAKWKEVAVTALRDDLAARGWPLHGATPALVV